jgi:hypothetical protein
MLNFKSLIITTVLAATCLLQTSEAEAGPLLDWLRGIRRNSGAQNSQYGYYGQPSVAQNAVAPNAAGLQPGQCMKTCNKTCSRTVVNYVPYTAYRTNWKKVPVTKYRPVTSSDPCTGCTTTCMKPCTTYTYQCQRVPYTTYRPVYRQEQYTVPVTTITNDCSTGTCGTGCNTCSTGQSFGGAAQNFNPTPATTVPSYAAPTPTYSAPPSSGLVPADTTPSLSIPGGSTSRLSIPRSGIDTANTYQVQSYSSAAPHTASAGDIRSATQGVRPSNRRRSFVDRLENQSGSRNSAERYTTQANRRNDVRQTTEMASLRRRWSYSPVRLASNVKTSNVAFGSVDKAAKVNRQQINSAWEDIK